MDNDEHIIWKELECKSYRSLQRIAKSMSLPSNVKKVYLIQMILAEKFKSEEELNSIIQKVKCERQQLSARKKSNQNKSHLQGSEVSSTNNTHSPPISQTPKRQGQMIEPSSPSFQQAFMNFKSKQNLRYPNTNKTYSSPRSGSDRVLRSCNVKTKPYYHLTESDIVHRSAQTDSNPTQSAIRNRKKPEFTTFCDNTYPIVRVPRAETQVEYSTVRADRPVLKTGMSESSSVIKPQSSSNRQEVRVDKQRCSKLPHNIIVKKYRPAILSSSANLPIKKPITKNKDVNNQFIRFEKISSPKQSKPMPVVVDSASAIPAKRQKMVKCILPRLSTETPPKITYKMVDGVSFRHKDGKISKINAVVLKSAAKMEICDISQPVHSIEVAVEDTVNSNTDVHTTNQTDRPRIEGNMTNDNINIQHHDNVRIEACDAQTSLPTPQGIWREDTHIQHDNISTMPCLSDVIYVSSDRRNISEKENNDSLYNKNYKKMRGEQVRSQRVQQRQVPNEECLPKINAVFSKFHDVNSNVMQPIYVQVSEESERVQHNPMYAANTRNTNLLENLYNFRNEFIVNQNLLQTVTTTNTHCVYSTPTMTTALLLACGVAFRALQRTGSHVSSAHAAPLRPEQGDQLHNAEINVPGLGDLLKIVEQDYKTDDQSEDVSSCSSLEQLSANITLTPEMEDALELISQDGDYMERIGMDVRMHCVLCTWTGGRFMLESHIRKEHANQIFKENKSQWAISFTLGGLVRSRQWSCRVLEHDALFVLAVKHEADQLEATLSSLEMETDLPKTGSITIYNKVTGEPYYWEGDIQCISPNLPSDNDVHGLQLKLSRLDLLPNSANLKLLNGELVLKSPVKVVVGQPELDDIHVILFVKIFN